MSINMAFTTLVVVLVFFTNAQGAPDTHPGWTRLAWCDRANGGFDLEPSAMLSLAKIATQVKLCTMGSSSDCVTSKQNTFPIQNLQGGKNRVDRGPDSTCSTSCATNTWTGPTLRVMAMRYSCSPRTGNVWVYHACGNGNGMHFEASKDPINDENGREHVCGWQSGISGALEMFIDAVPPTVAPTMAPTQWFENPGHQTNFSEVQRRLTDVERHLKDLESDDSVAKLESKYTSLQTQVDTLSLNFNALFEMVQSMNSSFTSIASSLDSKVSTAQKTADDVTSRVDSIRQALVDATESSNNIPSCLGGNCDPPSIESFADGDLVLNSPTGTVKITSQYCPNADMCDLSLFSDNLKEAIRKFP